MCTDLIKSAPGGGGGGGLGVGSGGGGSGMEASGGVREGGAEKARSIAVPCISSPLTSLPLCPQLP